MDRILVGSPIHQTPEILNEFLLSLMEVNMDGLDVDYCFVDDNTDEDSSNLLENFKNVLGEKATIFKSSYDMEYFCDDYTHRWSQGLVEKVTEFKNKIITFAIEQEYDYLFFIDSDIVLHPKTLKRLISTEKDIVANIFWTKWNPQVEPLPQVWLKDSYTLHDTMNNENITQGEMQQKVSAFIQQLRKPGTYRVGGLGACTLISRKALLTGVNFNPIYNISFWGEDRHFCIRAVALGLDLWVDTYYPAYHIYRSDDLPGVPEYKAGYEKRETEILGALLLDRIIEGVQGACSFNYKEDVNEDFLKFFTKKEGERLLKQTKTSRESSIAVKGSNKLQIMECQLTFYNNNSLVISTVKYNETGYKNEFSYYKEFVGKCTMAPVDGQWIISDWSVERRNMPNFIPLTRKAKEEDNKLTLSMIVKNEGDRYLRRALESAVEYIDNAVIIDDGSTDNTVEIIKEVLKDIPYVLIENKDSKFSNEIDLRKQQWFETIATNPDWIVFLDADEIFEDKFKLQVRDMMKNVDYDGYIFRLYDFWNEDHYRDDKLWCAHYSYRLFMIRYQKNFRYIFNETAQHCGRMPVNCMSLSFGKSELRLKHYGWSKEEDRIEKYERYMRLDPDGRFGNLDQYKSILDEKPTLARWTDHE